jgi:hypothetical protein
MSRTRPAPRARARHNAGRAAVKISPHLALAADDWLLLPAPLDHPRPVPQRDLGTRPAPSRLRAEVLCAAAVTSADYGARRWPVFVVPGASSKAHMDSDIAEIDGHASTRNAIEFQISEFASFHESLLHSGGSLRAGLCTRCDDSHNLAHCLRADRLALSLGPFGGLAQDQKPKRASGPKKTGNRRSRIQDLTASGTRPQKSSAPSTHALGCRIGRREREPRLAARPIMTEILSKPSPLPKQRSQLEHLA